MASCIKYDTAFSGSMAIEMEYESPCDLERSAKGDQYEPNALECKPKFFVIIMPGRRTITTTSARLE